MNAEPPRIRFAIDLEQLGRTGTPTRAEMQQLHALLCHQCGVSDPDEIVARWNAQAPHEPWSSEPQGHCAGAYAEELTRLVIAYMKQTNPLGPHELQ